MTNSINTCTSQYGNVFIQKPPAGCVQDRLTYFQDTVQPYWSNFLHVYTDANVYLNANRFVTSVYMPQLDVCYQETHLLQDVQQGSANGHALFAALHSAVKWFQTFPYKTAPIVFFSKAAETLNKAEKILCTEEDLDASIEEEFSSDFDEIDDDDRQIGFAWVPADSRIPEYEKVSNYTVNPFQLPSSQ